MKKLLCAEPYAREGRITSRKAAAKKRPVVKPAKHEAPETPNNWEARFIVSIIEITEKELLLENVEGMLKPCSKKDARYVKGHPSYVTAKSNHNEAIMDAVTSLLKLNGGSMQQDLLTLVIDLACRVCKTTKNLVGFKDKFLVPHHSASLGKSEG